MSVDAKAKVVEVLGDSLCADVGSIILDYMVSTCFNPSFSFLFAFQALFPYPWACNSNCFNLVTMPEFTGSTDELFELFYSFLVGVIEEEKLRDACGRLMDSFGKNLEVRDLLLLLEWHGAHYMLDERRGRANGPSGWFPCFSRCASELSVMTIGDPLF